MRRLFLLLSIFFFSLGSHLFALKMEERWVEVDQAKLFCRTLGEGKPLIVIHGGAGLSQDYLLPWLTRLAEHHFVIFYDQRGCGRSTGEINLQTIEIPKFVEDLDAIRKAFNFEKVAIFGHSWGGFVGMHYAISHSKSIDKLILSNSMPSTSNGLSLFINEYMRRTAPYQEEINAIQQSPEFEAGDPDFHAQWLRIIFGTYCYNPEKACLLNLCMSREACLNSMKVYQMVKQNVFDHPFDLNASLRKLNIPTLVIHGDVDPIPSCTAQIIHECIQGSQFLLISECGHFPYVEAPNAYFDGICNFLTDSAKEF